MHRTKDSIRNILVFTRSERRGIMILLILIALLLTIRIIQKQQIGNQTDIIIMKSELQISENMEIYDDSFSQYSYSVHADEMFGSTGKPFDPNEADLATLLEHRIPVPIANRIINYRLKGGVFYQPEDLFKIYNIDSSLVFELLSQVVIESKNKSKQTHIPSSIFSPLKINEQIEINSADSSMLCNFPGIGPILSRRIIKYREMLGGYYTIEQLREVYGISDSVFALLAQKLTIDTLKINRLALNSGSYSDLIQHPYLNSYEVKAILSYRRLVGPFDTCRELVENYILSENTYRRVRSYLSLK